jgi:SHS2 domain-containing protein
LEEALEYLVIALFGYMTQLSLVEAREEVNGTAIEAQGHDMTSMVFNFLQEWLYLFHEKDFLVKQVTIEVLDLDNFVVQSRGMGEPADWRRHVQGTEVKAVTYSNLQVQQDPPDGQTHIWVIVDI